MCSAPGATSKSNCQLPTAHVANMRDANLKVYYLSKIRLCGQARAATRESRQLGQWPGKSEAPRNLVAMCGSVQAPQG